MVSSSPLTSELPIPLALDQNTDLTPDVWARAMLYLLSRISALESFEPNWEQAVQDLNQQGLERLNDVLVPLYDKVANIGSLGAIFQCQSAGQQVLVIGSHTFLIDNLAQRSTFAPSQWMSAFSQDGLTAMAGYVTNYDRTNGLVTIDVVEVYGTGTAANFVISPSSPPFLAAAVVDGGCIDNSNSVQVYVPYVYAGPNAGAVSGGGGSSSSGLDGGEV